MSHKGIYIGTNARTRLKRGVNKLGDAVRVTLGAKGRNVVIETSLGEPQLTKDGVTVAHNIILKDPVERMGAEMLKKAAHKVVKKAGDGPQPLYSKILTPNGFVNMRDVKPGMSILGSNNTTQQVLEVFPKGQKEIVKIEFSSQQIVECCEDHLFTVRTNYGKEKTLTVKEMFKNFKTIKNNGDSKFKYFVKTEPIEFKQIDVPIDPYLIGVLLGDGSLTGTGSIEISLGKKKEHIINKLVLPEGISLNVTYVDSKNYFRIKLNGKTKDGKSMLDLLKDLNLNVGSNTKFIPPVYLGNSLSNRKKLLQGLIDTDGYINKRGLIEFTTISKQLANDFWQLMLSLGKSVKIDIHSRKNDINSYSDTPIYRLYERKGYKYGHKIVNIEYTGENTEMKCIKVSNSDNLYITDNFIFTHNTTSTTVIAQRMVNLLDEALRKDPTLNPVDLKNCIERLSNNYVKWVKDYSKKIDINSNDLNKVAIVSANNDTELGNLIADTFKKVGKEGIILVEDSQTHHTYSSLIEGVQYDRGYVSSQFITDESNKTCILEDVYVLISEKKITRLEEIKDNILMPLFEENGSLLIICEDIEPQVLAPLILNKKQAGFKICVVKTPSYGEHRFKLLEDMSIMTNGPLVSVNNGITCADLSLEDLGKAKKVIVTEETFTLIDAEGFVTNKEMINNRIISIKGDIENSISEFEKEQMEQRLAKLAAKVANLYVGGYTELEVKEKKDRVDDAIRAVQCALTGGIVPGGGMAYFDFTTSYGLMQPVEKHLYVADTILKESLQEPFKRILLNAGYKPMDIINVNNSLFKALCEKNNVFNVISGKVENGYDSGIIDPTIVAIEVVTNAVSVALSILMAECVIVDETNVYDEYKDRNREHEAHPFYKKPETHNS